MSLIKLAGNFKGVMKKVFHPRPNDINHAVNTAKDTVSKSVDKVKGIFKLAIESGPRTDLPNAWKVKKGMGPNANIPIARGLFKQAIEIPVRHLKGDTKEIGQIRALAKRIIAITREMNKEDEKAMK